VRLAHTRLRGAGFLMNGRRLRGALRALHSECPIDILDGPEASFALVPQEFAGRKVIRMHGGHRFFSVTLGRKPRPWRSWIERRSFNHATDLCAVSRFVADTTSQLLGLHRRPIEVLPNPVDVARFRPASSAAEEQGLIVFVGTMCEKKGVRQLLQAMPQIVAAVPSARLMMVGRDTLDPATGSFVARLRGLMDEQLRDRVVFRGPVPNAELPNVLARASVCAYPSHMEALPLAWLEGMAMGKAVVASQTGPGSEVIESRVSGLLCNPHDPSSIASSIITLLDSKGLRRSMGDAARARVLERFSADVLIPRNEAFYRQCLAGRHA
jgi:glycosyltransferase involved in cell wall biosynthesis